MTEVNLAGLDHVIVCTAYDNSGYPMVLLRHYTVQLKSSGTRVPLVELEECGPSLDLTIRRHQFASSALEEDAVRIPAQLKIKKKKNISAEVLGKYGRIHMQRQDMNKMALKKMKGLKKRATPEANAESNAEEAPQQQRKKSRSKKDE